MAENKPTVEDWLDAPADVPLPRFESDQQINDFLDAPDPQAQPKAQQQAIPQQSVEDWLDRPEDTWAQLGATMLEQAPARFKQSIAGMSQATSERPPTVVGALTAPISMTGQPGGPTMGDVASMLQKQATDWLREKMGFEPDKSAEVAAKMYAEAEADLQENAPNVDPDSLKGYAYDAGTSLIQMMPGLAATVLTKRPILGASMMGAQVGGQRYGQSRAEGRTPQQASEDMKVFGLAEGIPEMLPLGVLMKPGGKFLWRTLKTAGAESMSEILTQAVQDGYSAGVLKEDMTWGEAFDNLKRAGLLGAVLGGGMATVTHPFVRGEAPATAPSTDETGAAPGGADAAAAAGTPSPRPGGEPSPPAAAAATIPPAGIPPAAPAPVSAAPTTETVIGPEPERRGPWSKPLAQVGNTVGLKQADGPPERVEIEGIQDGYVFFRREDGSQDAAKESDFKRDLTTPPPPRRGATATAVPPGALPDAPPPTEGDINDFDPYAIREPVRQRQQPPSPQGSMALPETRQIQVLRDAATANLKLAAEAERIGQKTPQEIAAYKVEAAKLMDEAAALERRITPARASQDPTAATAEQLAARRIGPLGRAAPAQSEATTGPQAFPVTPRPQPAPAQPQLAPVARSEAEMPQEPRLRPQAPKKPWQQTLREQIGNRQASLNDPVAMARNLGTTPEAVTAELQGIAAARGAPIEIVRGTMKKDKAGKLVPSRMAGKWRYTPKPTGKATQSLSDFVYDSGGMAAGSFGGELEARDLHTARRPFKGNLIKPTARMNVQDMADNAQQSGFPVPLDATGDHADVDAFLNMLEQDHAGSRKYYVPGTEPAEAAPRQMTSKERKQAARRQLTALGFEPKGETIEELEGQLDAILDAVGANEAVDVLDFARDAEIVAADRMSQEAQDALREEAGNDYPDEWYAAEIAEGAPPAQYAPDERVQESGEQARAEPAGEEGTAKRAEGAEEAAPAPDIETSRATDEAVGEDAVIDHTEGLKAHIAAGGTAEEWVIENGKRTGTEFAAVIVNGEPRYGVTSNNQFAVSWYAPREIVDPGENVSVTHNHPTLDGRNNVGLSGSDLMPLIMPGFTFITAVTHGNHISSAALTPAAENWLFALEQSKATEAVARLYGQAMRGTMNMSGLDQLRAQDIAMRILARAGLVEYHTTIPLNSQMLPSQIDFAASSMIRRMEENGFKSPHAAEGDDAYRPAQHANRDRAMAAIQERATEIAARREREWAFGVGQQSDRGEGVGQAASRISDQPTTELTDQGEQFVLPGAERSDKQALAARAAQERIKPKKPQQAPGGLFDSPTNTIARLLADDSGAVPLPDWNRIKAYFARGNRAQTPQQVVNNAPKLGAPNRLRSFGTLARWLRSGISLASIDQPSSVYWNAQLDQENTKNTLEREAIDAARPYFRLDDRAKARIHKILEYARLYGVEIRNTGRDIVVRVPNRRPPFGEGRPELSRPDEIIALDSAETEAFFALRKMFDGTLMNMGAAMASERGYSGTFDRRSIEAAIQNATHPTLRRRAEAALDALDAVEEMRKAGYVPFQRYGDAWIMVKPKVPASGMPETARFEMIDTRTIVDSLLSRKGGRSTKALTERMEQLRRQYPARDYEITHGEVTPNLFQGLNLPALEKALIGLDANNVANKQKLVDDLMHELFEKRKAGFRKQSQNVPGYSLDFERAIMDYMRQTAAVSARMMHRTDVDSAYDGTQRHPVKEVRDFWREYKDHQESASDDFGMLRKIGFFMFLWGTPASAAVNLTQTPLVTMSQLATWAGPRAAGLANGAMVETLRKVRIGQEGSSLMSRQGLRNVARYSHGLVLDIGDIGKTQAEKDMLATLDSEGVLSPNVMEDFGAGRLSGGASSRMRPALKNLDRVYDIGASMFNTTEVVNRVTAALAYFRAAQNPQLRQKMAEVYKNDENFKQIVARHGMTPLAIARFGVNETQFIGGKMGRPKAARGIGALLLQFKNFVMNYLRLMHKNFRSMGPQGKLAGGFMLMSLFLIGGLAGIPFGEDLIKAYDTIGEMATGIDPDIEWQFREAIANAGFGEYGAQVMARGFGQDVFGLDMTRLGMGNIFPDNSVTSLAPLVTGTVGRLSEASDRWNTGQPVGAAAAMLGLVGGKGLQDVAKGFAVYPTEGISTKRGNWTVPPGEVTLADMTMRALGFQPSKATLASQAEYHAGRIANATKGARTAMLTRIARLVVQRSEAEKAGDIEAANDYAKRLEQEIQDNAANLLNEDIPDWQKIPPAKRQAIRQRVLSLTKPEIANIRRAGKISRPSLLESPFAQP